MIPVYVIYPSLPVQKNLGGVKFYPPLSLGAVISFAKKYRNGILNKKFWFLNKLFLDTQELKPAYKEHGAGVFLFSNYEWSISNNLSIAGAIKKWDGANISVFGGNSIPLKEKELIGFLKSHPQVDICVRGEGENSLAELLDRLCSTGFFSENNGIDLDVLKNVAGLAFRCGQGKSRETFIITDERKRESDLSKLPSPYLNHDFDEEDVPMWIYATLETNRGCPYMCSFCNWGVGVGGKVYKFSMRRVIDEINWLAQHEIPRITVCDANFGMFDRDIEIAEAVAIAKKEYGYPNQFVMSYPKTQVKRLAKISKIMTDAGVAAFGTISLQSMDPVVLKCARRKNVNTEELKELNREFRKEGLLLATDYMIGLPGATVQSVKNDLQFCFDNQMWTTCYSTIALPNTLLTDDDYVDEFKIKVGSDGFIVSTYSFSKKDLEEMKKVALAYRLYGAYGLLKYVLWYLQFDHQIKALDIIHGLSKFFQKPLERYPEVCSVSSRFMESGGHPGSALCPVPIGGWDAYYDEIRNYLSDIYSIVPDSGLETAFDVQRAVMPQEGRKLPDEIELKHDYSSYFFECLNRTNKGNRNKLIDFTGGKLIISDPHKICESLERGEIRGGGHIVYWELDSAMSMTKTMLFDIDPSRVD